MERCCVLLIPVPSQKKEGVEPDEMTFSSLIATTRDGSERSPDRGFAVSKYHAHTGPQADVKSTALSGLRCRVYRGKHVTVFLVTL